MKAEKEVVLGSIVVVGAFAPATFSADWLHRFNLIGDVDFEAMKSDPGMVCTSASTKLETPAFVFQVNATRLQVISKEVISPVIRDLVVGVLQLLGRPVLTGMGMNFMSHYRFPTEQDYHHLGDVLAPKPIWKSIFSDGNSSVGLADLVLKVRPAPRYDDKETRDGITVRIQPSNKVQNGVYMTYNNHRQFEEIEDCDDVIQFLQDNWEADWIRSDEVFSSLLARAEQESAAES